MHFTVLVIGDNPIEQLEPFREGENDPYLLGDNIHYSLYYPDEDDDEEVDEDEYYNWSNRECFDTEGAALEYALNNGLSTHRIVYEPAQTIYDWYEIGGRWAGYYKLKKDYNPYKAKVAMSRGYTNGKWETQYIHGRTDTASLSEIDLHGMLVQEAWIDRKAYRLGKKLFSLVHFDEGVAKAVEMCTELRKIAWNENESMRTYLNEMDTTYLFKSNSEQEYIKSRSGNTLSPYGLLYEGEYYESKYWNEDDDLNEGVSWHNHIKNLLLSLPSDTRITLVDCHI